MTRQYLPYDEKCKKTNKNIEHEMFRSHPLLENYVYGKMWFF